MTVRASEAVPSAKVLDTSAITLMVMLCMSWGLNQVAVKLALPDIPPLIQGVFRSAGALSVVMLWVWWRRIPLLTRDGTLRAGLAVGLLFGFEFLLVFQGLRFTTASRAGLFLYTAPFFVAIGASWLIPGEKLSPLQWGGLLLCFTGLVVSVGVPDPHVTPDVLFGDGLMVAAGAAWALTTLVIKLSTLATARPEKTLAYQLAISVPVMGLGAVVMGEHIDHVPGMFALSWLGYQAFWVTGITYLIWFGMVRDYSASRLSAFTFLSPLFGVLAGFVILGDPITPPFAAAVALVILGLLLVNRPRRA